MQAITKIPCKKERAFKSKQQNDNKTKNENKNYKKKKKLTQWAYEQWWNSCEGSSWTPNQTIAASNQTSSHGSGHWHHQRDRNHVKASENKDKISCMNQNKQQMEVSEKKRQALSKQREIIALTQNKKPMNGRRAETTMTTRRHSRWR